MQKVHATAIFLIMKKKPEKQPRAVLCVMKLIPKYAMRATHGYKDILQVSSRVVHTE